MSAPKFTPGPWKVDERNCHSGNIATVHGCTAGWAEIWSEHWMDVGLGPDVQDANIALIAAAPVLFEALRVMVDKATRQNWNDQYPDQLAQAQAALAKAVQP